MTDAVRARVSPPFFAIPFGLSGLASAWAAAAAALGAPVAVARALWLVVGVVWVVVVAAYAVGVAHTPGALRSDLHHPLQGPFLALAPVVAILFGGALCAVAPTAGRIVVVVAVVAIGVLSAWSLSAMLTGALDAHLLHPGYFLYTLAGGLIGAIGLAQAGWHVAALAAWGVGVFFWIVLAAAVVARLAASGPLPDAAVPALAIFSVPPSVAGLAWFAIAGDRIDAVHVVLLALMLFLLVGQAFLVPRYARVPFGLGWWSFTFTAAAPAGYGIRLLHAAHPAGWPVWAWLVLAVVTLWIGGIGVRTLVRLASRR